MSDDTERESAARKVVLSHCEPWVREYASEHGQLPPGLMFRVPFVETLLIEARAQTLEEAAREVETWPKVIDTGDMSDGAFGVIQSATAKLSVAIRALANDKGDGR